MGKMLCSLHRLWHIVYIVYKAQIRSDYLSGSNICLQICNVQTKSEILQSIKCKVLYHISLIGKSGGSFFKEFAPAFEVDNKCDNRACMHAYVYIYKPCILSLPDYILVVLKITNCNVATVFFITFIQNFISMFVATSHPQVTANRNRGWGEGEVSTTFSPVFIKFL